MWKGAVQLQVYDDEIQIYGAKGSGLKLICISECPDEINDYEKLQKTSWMVYKIMLRTSRRG